MLPRLVRLRPLAVRQTYKSDDIPMTTLGFDSSIWSQEFTLKVSFPRCGLQVAAYAGKYTEAATVMTVEQLQRESNIQEHHGPGFTVRSPHPYYATVILAASTIHSLIVSCRPGPLGSLAGNVSTSPTTKKLARLVLRRVRES